MRETCKVSIEQGLKITTKYSGWVVPKCKKIYPSELVDLQLSEYFTIGNISQCKLLQNQHNEVIPGKCIPYYKEIKNLIAKK